MYYSSSECLSPVLLLALRRWSCCCGKKWPGNGHRPEMAYLWNLALEDHFISKWISKCSECPHGVHLYHSHIKIGYEVPLYGHNYGRESAAT